MISIPIHTPLNLYSCCLHIGAMAFDEAAFGRGSGKIWIDEAMCLGTEESLLECQANAIGDTDCNHNEDAGVRCLNGELMFQLHWQNYYGWPKFVLETFFGCANR